MDKLKNLLKNPRSLIYVLAGGVILFLLYRYFSAGKKGAGDQTQPTPDQTGTTAAEQVGAQEAADVSQLQSDIGGLQGTIGQLQSALDALTPAAGGAAGGSGDPPAIATGTKKKHRGAPPNPHKRKPPKSRHKPRPDHPKGHQSNKKHAGSGSIAPSHHGRPRKKQKAKGGFTSTGGPGSVQITQPYHNHPAQRRKRR